MKFLFFTLGLWLSVFHFNEAKAETLDQLLASGERMKALSFVQKTRKSDEGKLTDLIANQFFKQKSQELAELALSYWVRNRPEAEAKVLEALKGEPDNFYLLKLKWIFLLERNECKLVEDELKPWLGFHSLDEVNLFKARIATCQKTPFEAPASPKKNKVFWGLIQAQQTLEKQEYQKASMALNQLELIDQNMPEIYWLRTKTNQQLKAPLVDAAKKYLALCRNITHRQIREYLLQPNLCQQVKEAEDLLK